MNAYEFATDGKSLAHDLADQLRLGRERQLTFVECELPDGGRADVLTINPVASKRIVHVYEVKTSRRDFWSDVNSGKFERYALYAHRVYFATPTGLVKKDEVPVGCGLITKGANGWRVVKPPTPNKPLPLTAEWMITLIDRAFWKDLPRLRRIADRVVVKENMEIAPRAWAYGRAVGEKLHLAERGALDPEIEADARLGRAVRELAVEMGLTKRTDSYAVEQLAKLAVAQMREAQAMREIGSFLMGYGERSADRVMDLLRAR